MNITDIIIKELRQLANKYKYYNHNGYIDTDLLSNAADKLEEISMQNRLLISILREKSLIDETTNYIRYAYESAKESGNEEDMTKLARALIALQAETSMDIFKDNILDELATIE